MLSLTRRYHFSASHRLHSPLLSASENAAVFGKCNNPHGHGHNYVLSVTAAGEVDERTGLLVRIKDLDRLVDEKVLHLFAHHDINRDVPEFSGLIPTTENIALIIAGLLQQSWGGYLDGAKVHLERVHVQETERNGFEVVISAAPVINEFRREGVLVHA